MKAIIAIFAGILTAVILLTVLICLAVKDLTPAVEPVATTNEVDFLIVRQENLRDTFYHLYINGANDALRASRRSNYVTREFVDNLWHDFTNRNPIPNEL